jgi:hypothetical protein
MAAWTTLESQLTSQIHGRDSLLDDVGMLGRHLDDVGALSLEAGAHLIFRTQRHEPSGEGCWGTHSIVCLSSICVQVGYAMLLLLATGCVVVVSWEWTVKWERQEKYRAEALLPHLWSQHLHPATRRRRELRHDHFLTTRNKSAPRRHLSGPINDDRACKMSTSLTSAPSPSSKYSRSRKLHFVIIFSPSHVTGMMGCSNERVPS